MSHQCPGPECPVEDVDDDKLACVPHWYQVPRDIRSRVYATWNNGAGAGSPAHTRAMTQAIATMRPLGARHG